MRVETTRVARRRATELTWKSAALVALLTILLVSLVSIAVAAIAPRGSASTTSVVGAQPGSIPWNGRDRLNVLLLGFSSPAADPARLSAMMVLSYDPAKAREELLSVPVSLWVTVPGFGQDTIGNAFADGGPRLSLLVTQSVTHLVIPYYLAMGRDALRQLIDTYGGVTVRAPQFITVRDPAGTRHLTGDAAMRYINAGGSDPSSQIARFPRLERLFIAVQHQALQPSSLFQIAATVNALGGSIATNFPFSQAPMLARQLSGVPSSRIETSSLDYGNGAVTDYTANGTQVLLPDWQRIHELARSLIGSRPVPGSVEVLNGSGQQGAAAALATWFGQLGVRVSHFGSADSFSYPQTQVVLNGRVSRSQRASAGVAATLLQAPIVTRRVRYSRSPVIVIIGADFQNPVQQ